MTRDINPGHLLICLGRHCEKSKPPCYFPDRRRSYVFLIPLSPDIRQVDTEGAGSEQGELSEMVGGEHQSILIHPGGRPHG